ncbi:hypothetical protein H2248_001606 [Termitomyces sp. 'cryptogamus']|nr:hypothetical protein H2248_001606 [Termitomyces sp. 'cryptogamus']
MMPPFTNVTGTSCHADSWAVRDAKAAGIIIAYVSDQLALEVGELAHAKDMFDKLVTIHVNTNVGVSAFYTFISMLNLKWDGSSSTLSNHISMLLAADAKLTAMKKEINYNIWESFKATVLNLLAPGTPLTFSALSNQLTFTATAQQSTSSEAAFKADSNAKLKFKNKLETWCQFHNSSMHNTANCRTLREKDDKKEKGRAWKKKKKEKANCASHNSSLEPKSSDDKPSGGVAGYSTTKSAYVSKALMTWILAYVGNVNPTSMSGTIADSGTSTHMTPHQNWFKCNSFKELSPP